VLANRDDCLLTILQTPCKGFILAMTNKSYSGLLLRKSVGTLYGFNPERQDSNSTSAKLLLDVSAIEK
jgi:hypothetical protein